MINPGASLYLQFYEEQSWFLNLEAWVCEEDSVKTVTFVFIKTHRFTNACFLLYWERTVSLTLINLHDTVLGLLKLPLEK